MPLSNWKSSALTMTPFGWTPRTRPHTGTPLTQLLLATNAEVRRPLCRPLRHLLSDQTSPTRPLWPPQTPHTTHKALVIAVHGSCYWPPGVPGIQRYPRSGRPTDQNGPLHPHQRHADAAELARLFLQHVWTSHGLPKDIVSDRGTTFTSQFWRTLCNQLDIKPRFSTAFHPQTDGQTERVNAIMEQYLRGYVNYQQDNWSEFLPLAEFAHNNATTEPLGVSPFFANYGYNPQLDTLPSEERHESTPKEVVDFANSISTLQAALRSEILYAQAAATDSANAARLPEPHLEVGDMVWLSRKHIRTTRPSDKLDHKRLGKFRILERIGSHAYRLELPASMKSHPVFHVSSLEPARRHPLPGHIQPPPPPVIVEGEEEFEVQEVMDSRIRRNQLQYLVKWTGYEQPTWEPARNLDAELGSLQRFHSLYPSKPSRDATKPKARKV
ncbi:uncharacterized protein LAJ45_11399 [Morchella importuna]|uniref:uncharacterized protein n=1 Tax=Morchella importuna TaxID=1174673 RepID=UPI001E8D4788|nr:uncharacterized protein LAJ45_11399 [Morchella importuna]KAH8144565.1 hypothetical protein LAJ45_11399 [Morchella importuna]